MAHFGPRRSPYVSEGLGLYTSIPTSIFGGLEQLWDCLTRVRTPKMLFNRPQVNWAPFGTFMGPFWVLAGARWAQKLFLLYFGPQIR